MKIKSSYVLILFILFAIILSACSGAAFTPGGFPGVTVDENTAYVAFNQYVYAINLADGTQKWRYPEKTSANKTFFSPPALTPDGQLLVGSYDNKLYSLNPANGQENSWSFQANFHFIGGPLVLDQTIYAPNGDKNLYALDLHGKTLWQFSAKAALWAKPETDDQCNCLYLSSMDHHVYSISTEGGRLNWERDLGSALVSSPAVGPDGRLYVGTFGNEMVALNASDGSVIWRTPVQSWVWSEPAIDNDRLYFGDIKGSFYALQTSDGKIIWQIQPDGPVNGTPLVTKDAIYFATELGSVYAIDRDGKSLWNQPVGGKIYTAPVAAGDLILIAPNEASPVLVALNTNGTTKWSFVPPK